MIPSPAVRSSGIAAVDARWGGYATSAAYALVGRADGGRLTLALHAVRAAIDGGARCLLVSPREPGALAQAAQGLGMDLAAAHADGRLRLLRMPGAETLAARGDAGLAAAYADLARLIGTDRPDRVVIDDLTPLVQFETLPAFSEAFVGLAAAVASVGATLLVGLGEPANEASDKLLGVVRAHTAGMVQIEGDAAARRLVLHGGPAAPAPAVPPSASPRDSEPVASAAPEAVAPPPSDLAPPEAPTVDEGPLDAPATSHTGDGIPITAISPPPPVDPALAAATADPFALDASGFMAQGFLVDSGAGAVVGRVPLTPPASAPGWTPLHIPPPAPRDDDRAAFVSALDAAYAAGAPFDVVALRMKPSAPAAAHFALVVDGLRPSVAAGDALFVDAERCRAIVYLAGADRSAGLFAGLQAHVRQHLGDAAAGVLAAVAAAPIPGGAPFTSGEALVGYAVDQ